MKKLLLILSFVLFSYSANAEGKDFKQWTCYKFFDDSKVVLTIGYFPDTIKKGDSVGLMKLNTNNQTIPVLHFIEGIKDTFVWGEKWVNKLTISVGDGMSWIYDFTGVKEGESTSPSETLNCKNRTTVKKDKRTMEKLLEEMG